MPCSKYAKSDIVCVCTRMLHISTLANARGCALPWLLVQCVEKDPANVDKANVDTALSIISGLFA